jgi:SAM-dependent methyltransferase
MALPETTWREHPAGGENPKENSCPACGGQLSRRKEWLQRCPECRYLCSSLPPGAGTGIEGLEAVRRANFETLLDGIARHRPLAGARLLEVGCARGLFLDAARRRGVVVRGIEPERANAQIAQRAGFAVDDGFFPQDLTDKGPYDLVVFNDVFEHLPRPERALQDVEGLLAPGGMAVLNLPTSDGALYKIASVLDRLGLSDPFDRLWQRGLPSPHVSYFNAANLTALALAHTSLRPIGSVRLRSVERSGLYSRVKSVNGGLKGDVLFAGAWAFSFLAGMLPSDIMALLFAKP